MMLSRLVRPSALSRLGNGTFVPASQFPANTWCVVRCLTSGTKAQAPYKEGPERDLTNFPPQTQCPQIGAWLEKEQQQVLDELNAGKLAEIQALKDSIEAEKKAQFQADGVKLLFDVKCENVALQLEAVYRERLMEVFQEVKRRLDYQVEKVNVERNIQQRHMVNWIVDSVKKAITTESEQENLKKCLTDLKALAVKA